MWEKHGRLRRSRISFPRGAFRGVSSKTPWAFSVYETGGTTGQTRRIAEMTSRYRGVEWVSQVLDSHGFPGVEEGHWLHIGPTGPHIVGRSVGLAGSHAAGVLLHGGLRSPVGKEVPA